MAWDDPNIYYSPGHYGLTPLHEIDDPEACYSFDLFVLWQHEDGRMFYATDSGCSCPSPFEMCKGLDDLTELTDASWDEFAAALAAWCDSSWYSDSSKEQAAMDRHEMTRAAALALAAKRDSSR